MIVLYGFLDLTLREDMIELQRSIRATPICSSLTRTQGLM